MTIVVWNKTLVLWLHPSLIQQLCPPSEIGNAYAVLSNPDKRRQYDLTGGEESSSSGHSHGGGFEFHRGFEADITPEDLFNMFFGGGFPSCKHACVLVCFPRMSSIVPCPTFWNIPIFFLPVSEVPWISSLVCDLLCRCTWCENVTCYLFVESWDLLVCFIFSHFA